MAESGAIPTRVDRVVQAVRGEVAHGPEKAWGEVGQRVTISVTVPLELAKWARADGYVFSRILTEALVRLRDRGEQAEVRRQLEFHRQQVAILEAAAVAIAARTAEEESAKAQESAREGAVRALAEEFQRLGRGSLGRSRNLAWLEARVARAPALKSLRVEAVLDLILASQPEGSP